MPYDHICAVQISFTLACRIRIVRSGQPTCKTIMNDHERDNKQKFLQQATTSALKLQAIGKGNQAQASSTSFEFYQQNQHFFPEMDSTMTDSRKRTQKWTQIGATVVVSCPDNCFLFRKRAREAASQGTSGQGHSSLFDAGGYLFFASILGTLFFIQICSFGFNYGRNFAPKSTLDLTWEVFFTFFEDP